MFFYFTETGNSLYIAKQLDKQQISIPQIIQRFFNMTFEELEQFIASTPIED